MAQARVKIGSTGYSVPEAVVEVIWDYVLSYKRDGDGVNFEIEPKSDITIVCRKLPDTWLLASVDWDYLLAGFALCHDFQMTVEVNCGGSWTAIATEWTFNPKDWKIDYDKKTITFKVRENSVLNCLKRYWTTEQNIFGILPPVTIKPYQYALKTTTDTEHVGPDEECPTAVVPSGYCLDIVEDYNPICIYHYHRFEKAGSCSGSTPVAPDTWNTWTLLSGSCPGTPIFWACPNTSRLPFEFKNGRMLQDVIQYLLDETDCGLTLVSDFFSFDPDSTAPTNDAYTAAAADLANLVVFQKSDVKRHDATNSSLSPSWNMKLQDLLQDLATMFKVDWRITASGTVFRLEHVSYWSSSAGADYTNESYLRELQFDKEKISRFNRFQYRDKQCTSYFAGKPIEIYCGEGESEKRLSLFSCDVSYISDADNAEGIGDDGFVLMAAFDSGGTLYNTENNRVLSWTELHTNYHRHEMAGAGKINNTDVTPLSIKKTRKQPAFSVRHCCTDTFDPSDYITTSLGNGDVESAEWAIVRDTLTVELKY